MTRNAQAWGVFAAAGQLVDIRADDLGLAVAVEIGPEIIESDEEHVGADAFVRRR